MVKMLKKLFLEEREKTKKVRKYTQNHENVFVNIAQKESRIFYTYFRGFFLFCLIFILKYDKIVVHKYNINILYK